MFGSSPETITMTDVRDVKLSLIKRKPVSVVNTKIAVKPTIEPVPELFTTEELFSDYTPELVTTTEDDNVFVGNGDVKWLL